MTASEACVLLAEMTVDMSQLNDAIAAAQLRADRFAAAYEAQGVRLRAILEENRSLQRIKSEVMHTHNLPDRVTGKDGKSCHGGSRVHPERRRPRHRSTSRRQRVPGDLHP